MCFLDSKDTFLTYGRSSCPFCTRAHQLLKQASVECLFFDLEKDRRFLEEAKNFYGYETVPIILRLCYKSGIANFVGGCDDLEELLNVR